ncbi:hypothetical protein Dvar_68500 [Desulfosarcina variabilis str. Montpellier]|uniref:hypothetical protein n=1 Tax=Desulfosarcina variabilis TaxID=2300 RepID=UPI003AFA83DA
MPGIKGMTDSRPRRTAVRMKVWQSMRIMGRFTIPDLCRTSGASSSNVRKFIHRLVEHGYVAMHQPNVSGQTGSYHCWRLVKNIGREYPMKCERCGRVLGEPCEPEKNDER